MFDCFFFIFNLHHSNATEGDGSYKTLQSQITQSGYEP